LTINNKTKTVIREKLHKPLLYEKGVHKMLMKLTPVVKFINVKRARFSYERRFSTYFLALLKNLYEKGVHKMLMKLTPGKILWEEKWLV